jgi:Holliday junction DNA helicase RuvB
MKTDPAANDRYSDQTPLPSFVGQRDVCSRLRVAIDVSAKRGDALGHILIEGPVGIGKRMLALSISRELGVSIQIAKRDELPRWRDLLPYLTNVEERSVLFIDEIDRLPKDVEDFLQPAMQEYRINVGLCTGETGRTLNLQLKPFTLIGSTTRASAVSDRLRHLFLFEEHLAFYSHEEIAAIVARQPRTMGIEVTDDAVAEIASRSQGIPGVACKRLRWVCDYALSHGAGQITLPVARAALDVLGVNASGYGAGECDIQSGRVGRESIPEEVRNAVWRRDQGRCVQCGSNEKLEFDHIIPVSKGGSSTARNLQLLCERCNRKKSDQI